MIFVKRKTGQSASENALSCLHLWVRCGQIPSVSRPYKLPVVLHPFLDRTLSSLSDKRYLITFASVCKAPFKHFAKSSRKSFLRDLGNFKGRCLYISKRGSMFEFQSLTRQREDTGHVFLVDVRLHAENGHVVFRDALLAVIDDVFFAHVQGGRAGEKEDVRVQKVQWCTRRRSASAARYFRRESCARRSRLCSGGVDERQTDELARIFCTADDDVSVHHGARTGAAVARPVENGKGVRVVAGVAHVKSRRT